VAAVVEPEPAPEPEPAALAIDQALADKGEKVFKKCKSCHQVGDTAKHKTGPALNAIYNAGVGVQDGFRYSKVMAGHGGVWDDATLTEFLAKPRKAMKGTKMSFAGLKKDADITAVIEYLKLYSQ
jgi:cytochrome c